MAYFNYHAKIKRLIMEGKLTGYGFYDNYNGIEPALVLYFGDKAYPIRKYRWEEYLPFLIEMADKIKNFQES